MQATIEAFRVPSPRRYDELAKALDRYGYAVSRGEHGYILTNHTDPSDISYARHLDDLADFAELMRWREQWTIRRQQGR